MDGCEEQAEEAGDTGDGDEDPGQGEACPGSAALDICRPWAGEDRTHGRGARGAAQRGSHRRKVGAHRTITWTEPRRWRAPRPREAEDRDAQTFGMVAT